MDFKSSWEKILLELYHSPLTNLRVHNKSLVHNKEHLTKKLNIQDYQLSQAIDFLLMNKLIEKTKSKDIQNSNSYIMVILTEKGFNVALDIEKQNTNNITSSVTLIFSAILALTAITQVYLAYLKDPSIFSQMALFMLCACIIIIGYVFFYLKNK